MSKEALYFYAENLRLIQRATFTTSAGKSYGLGENGRDLLNWLCNAANTKQGYCFHMGYAYIAEETDIHIATVKRLMAGLEQLGWITRTGETIRHMGRGAPTVEYELTFFTASLTQNTRTGSPTSRPGATDNLAKPAHNMEAGNFLGLETEPEPEPEPDRLRSDDLQTAKAGKEREEILNLCIDFETAEMQDLGKPVKPRLRQIWRAEFPAYIAEAIENRHGDTPGAIARWCIEARREKRTGYTSANTSPDTGAVETVCGRCRNKNRDIKGCEGLSTQWNGHLRTYTVCEQCNGTGRAMLQDMTEDDYAPHPTRGTANCLICDGSGFPELQTGYRKCVCIGGTWNGEETLQPSDLHPESVDTDQARSTDTPAPNGIAMAQALNALRKGLRAS